MLGREKRVTKNAEQLKRIPGLKETFDEVIKSGESFQLLESENRNVQALLTNPKRAAAAMWTQTDPTQALDKMLSDPLTARSKMTILKRRAKKGEGDGAVKGLQQSIFDWVLKNSTATGSNTVSSLQDNFVSGANMSLFLKNKTVLAIVEEGLTPTQIKRLEAIRGHALQLDAIRSSPELSVIIEKGWVASSVGALGGARLGRYVLKLEGGGSDLQTPGRMSKLGQKLARNIFVDYPKVALIEAFTSEDGKLLEGLLTLPTTKDKILKLSATLNTMFTQYLVLHQINTADFDDKTREDVQNKLDLANDDDL